jgi:2-iminobutanoate/2-iminopropanoate deaminase
MQLEKTLSKQTQRICENIKAICNELEIDMSDICKTTIYLTDINVFERVNSIYGMYFSHKPARSCVQISALPK